MSSFAESVSQLQDLVFQTKFWFPYMLNIVGILWVINFINWKLLKSRLNIFGVIPRYWFGIFGIFLAPIWHKDYNHLFFNSLPLLILGTTLLSFGAELFILATILITILEGTILWLFGRPGNHIGASGLIMGYLGFILYLAHDQPGVISISVAGVAIYYFGSLLFGIFPSEEQVSWEGHLFGLISGMVSVPICKYLLFERDWFSIIAQWL